MPKRHPASVTTLKLHTPNEALDAVAKRQQQIVTRAQLIAAGVDDMAMCRRTKRGLYQRVLPGIYALVTGTLTSEQLRIAAVLYAGSNAQITGLSALEWYGFRYAPKSEKIHLLVPHEERRRSVGHVVVHRALALDEFARHTELYTVCSPARAVVDACRDERDLRTVRAMVAESVQRGLTGPHALNEEVRRAGRSRTALVRRAAQEVIEGIRSAAEGDLYDCLSRSKRLPRILWNPRLFAPDGTALPTPDAWLPEVAVALEVDSREHHSSVEDWQRTLDRHNILSRYGALVLHFTPREIRHDPDRVLWTVEETSAAREGAALTCQVLTRAPSYA